MSKLGAWVGVVASCAVLASGPARAQTGDGEMTAINSPADENACTTAGKQVVTKDGKKFGSERLFPVRFVPLVQGVPDEKS